MASSLPFRPAETDADLFVYDFSELCSSTGYQVPQKNNPALNATVYFNVCARSPVQCLSASPEFDQGDVYMYGNAVQMWGTAPTGQTCKAMGSTQEQPCTAPCAVLGESYPHFDLQTDSNPKTGGVRLSHTGAPPLQGSQWGCPADPVTGASRARNITYVISCDPDVEFAPLYADESPECVFSLYARSRHACGTVYSGPDSAASETGLIAGMFFLGAFVALVAVGVVFVVRNKRRLFNQNFTAFGSGTGDSAPAPAGNQANMGSAKYSTV